MNKSHGCKWHSTSHLRHRNAHVQLCPLRTVRHVGLTQWSLRADRFKCYSANVLSSDLGSVKKAGGALATAALGLSNRFKCGIFWMRSSLFYLTPVQHMLLLLQSFDQWQLLKQSFNTSESFLSPELRWSSFTVRAIRPSQLLRALFKST